MSLSKVESGVNAPSDVYAIIEIPQNSSPVKYEVDKDTDCVFVDRLLTAPMFYPCNYGYVNKSLSLDGDPVDILIHTPFPLVVGSVIRCRPVAVLQMEDESGIDAKVIAVPHSSISKEYESIKSLADLPALLKQQIEHFFTNYKNLEPNKWVKIKGWSDVDAAEKEITDSIKRYSEQ